MRNDIFLDNKKFNCTFEEILSLSEDEFKQWVVDLRKFVVDIWDNHGCVPRVGYSEEDTIRQFNEMIVYPVEKLLRTDEVTGETNVIRNMSGIGTALNGWFPSMMKTRIAYSLTSEARSVYDYFSRDDLFKSFHVRAKRHFRKDSFYNYCIGVNVDDRRVIDGNIAGLCGTVDQFIKSFKASDTHSYFFLPVSHKREYTGYVPKLYEERRLTITRSEIENLVDSEHGRIPSTAMLHVNSECDEYNINLYALGQRLFPIGFIAFRVSFAQTPMQFPPLTARYLYERYLSHVDKGQDRVVLYDPSCGWAGRLLGAMSIDDRYNILYVGTDPNPDMQDGEVYREIADYFNNKTYRGNSLFPKTHECDIYSLGSEVIHENTKFQKYKGKVDLVFTSPPYFTKELYSTDSRQSAVRFPEYNEWRDGYLYPTLRTCVEWLKEDRFLLWNISDVKYGKEILPLEQDSITFLQSLGMEYVDCLKMSMAQMPGSNRLDPVTGLPHIKNFCKLNGVWLKYEPVYIFYKPKS